MDVEERNRERERGEGRKRNRIDNWTPDSFTNNKTNRRREYNLNKSNKQKLLRKQREREE